MQQQSGVSLEHLIVDGASTDGTIEFLRAYRNTKHDIRILSMADSGIYQAMITTVGGLAVGIVALFGYNYLVAKIDGVVNEIEAKSLTFMDIVSQGE